MVYQKRAIQSLLLLVLACCSSPTKRENQLPQAATTVTPLPVPSVNVTVPAREDAHDAVPSSPSKLTLLASPEPLVSLEVPGFLDAVVSVPNGTTEPRPVVLALHGNFDRPEWQCEVMRDITKAYPFILCPRGVARKDVPKSADRWEYGSLKKVKEEIDSGILALQTRYAGYVAEGPLVFTGFSLGAILGRSIVAADPKRFPRVLLTEGGSQGWNFKRFKEHGGQRVLFGCGQAGCAQSCRSLAKQAERASVDVHVAYGGNVGHTYDGTVARAIQAEWAWLVDGDDRWLR